MLNLTNINELAKKFNINKSKLFYWRKEGKIKEVAILSDMLIFDKNNIERVIIRLLNK